MKKLLLVLLCVTLVGCTAFREQIIGKEYYNHKNREKEIEEAYNAGEITKKEYLDLKLQNDQTYRGSSMRVNVNEY